MRYLLYLSFHDSFHSHIDKLIYNVFRSSKPSKSVRIYSCQGSLPYCPAIDTPIPKLTFLTLPRILKSILIQSILRPIYCTKCINRTNKYFELGLAYRCAPLGLPLLIKSLALYFSRSTIRTKLHESCFDNTISCYLVNSRMEIADVRPSFKLARFLVTRDYHMQQSLGLLNSYSPDIVGMTNGRMLPFRSMLNIATSLSSRHSVLIHERGFEDSTFILKINEPAHSRNSMSQLFAGDYAFLSNQISYKVAHDWAHHFFDGRKSGANIDCAVPIYSTIGLGTNSLYSTKRKLVVFYMTTPDEVDSFSEEFLLVRHQWHLIPMVCQLLNNSLGEAHIDIVVRLHPNFFLRYNTPLYNIKKKIDLLKNRLKLFSNVSIDFSPNDTSPFVIYKNSFLSVSFASSSLLESEHFGTPSLVDSNHIYKYGVSYSFDFRSLLDLRFDHATTLPTSMIQHLHSGNGVQVDKVSKFTYLWYHLSSFRFDTVKFQQFNKVTVSDIHQEDSSDYNFLKMHHCLDSVNFIRSKINYSIDS